MQFLQRNFEQKETLTFDSALRRLNQAAIQFSVSNSREKMSSTDLKSKNVPIVRKQTRTSAWRSEM